MQPYTGFASVYDMFMDNVPYDEWTEYIQKLLRKFNINEGLLLELGCGTGSMTRRLAEHGYDMIGIDNSEEMLQIAREKGDEWSDSILYLCQDMREFELFGTVAAAISVCDSMNYLVTEEDLLKVFRLVNNYLDPQGVFIFDLDTQYAYQEILGDNTIAENREEGSFIWENTYYEDEMINEINLTLFIPEKEDKETYGHQGKETSVQQDKETSGNQDKETSWQQDKETSWQQDKEASGNQGNSDAIYRKHEETHYRKAYSIETVKHLLEEAGMEWIAAYDALTERKPRKDSERIYIIAREKRQDNKLYIEQAE